MKKKKLIFTLGLASALTIAAVGCGNAETTDITDAESPLADSVENTADSQEDAAEDTLVYGTLNLS